MPMCRTTQLQRSDEVQGGPACRPGGPPGHPSYGLGAVLGNRVVKSGQSRLKQPTRLGRDPSATGVTSRPPTRDSVLDPDGK